MGKKRKRNEDGGMTEEGPVVDIKGLADGVKGPDLVKELQDRFGHNIVNVLMLQRRAHVEYEDTTGSSNLVTHAAKNKVCIFGQPVSINYSKYTKILVNPPSRMVIIRISRAQRDDIKEADVVSAMQRFGAINSVVMNVVNRGLAHVEYEDMTGSVSAVTYAAENQLLISGHPVSINYGKDEGISEPPSRVVFIRFRSEQRLVDGITKSDLVEAMQVFGTISKVSMMLQKGWAHVEYEDIAGSGKAVNYAAENQVLISGLPVSICYSSSNVVETPPSPRVFVLFRGEKQVDDITEAGLVAAMQEFGTIRHVLKIMLDKRQALVEYDDMTGSANAVTYAAKNQVYISGHPVFINYSKDIKSKYTKSKVEILPSPAVEIRDVVDGVTAPIGGIVDANKPTCLNVSKNSQDADVKGNRKNSQDPNANSNKRARSNKHARQRTFLGDRPPRYGGPQGGYHHYNNNYESYDPPPHYEGCRRRMEPPMGCPPPHYEGRRPGPPIDAPPTHYEGRRHRMEPQLDAPTHYEGRRHRMEPQLDAPHPHYQGRRMGPPIDAPHTHFEGRRHHMEPPMDVLPHYEGHRMEPPIGGPPSHYEGRRMRPPMDVPPEYGRHSDWSGRLWP